ncbi:uncharacterized protein I303_106273 [Kwoniella dejecticola CBS 10117]|uniref:RING-type domain-containing protein n=1 Tax=Kwoniella dejecticola CBS 10117 TaxID=1296121 RepID=A0AAJ8MJJ6_9TREE
MGSSQSQPQRNDPSRLTAQTPSSPPPPPVRRHSRLNSLRRLSTLGKREKDVSTSSKRLRQGSSTSDSILGGGSSSSASGSRDEGRKKKARASSPEASGSHTITEETLDSSLETTTPPVQKPTDEPMDAISETIAPSTEPSIPENHSQPAVAISPPTPVQPTTAHPETQPPLGAASIPLPLTPSSESSDPLAEERRNSLSLIRDTLGPEWPVIPASSSASPSTSRAFHPFRRSTSSPDLNDQSTSEHRIDPLRSMSDRLTALLGFTSPSSSSDVPVAASSARSPRPPTGEGGSGSGSLEENESTIQELTERLNQAREELAQTERQLTEARERVERRRVTPGAVLIIQGLAQTHALPSEEEIEHTEEVVEGSSPRRRPGMRGRRSSEGSQGIGRRGLINRHRDREEGPSIETQARMIGGLLTVTAAATATTLLAPSSPPFPPSNPRSPAASALESIVNRIRPRPNRAQTVEAALGNYLRTALQGENDSSAAAGSSATPAAGHEGVSAGNADLIATDFQRFLEGVQGDLVGAVREFAGPVPGQSLLSTSAINQSDASEVNHTRSDALSVRSNTATVGTADIEMRDVGEEESFVTAPSSAPTPVPLTPVEGQMDLNSGTLPADPVIPTFHSQLGQNLPRTTNSPSPQVTGGTDGQPRRLNFFRAHMFPPLPVPARTPVEGQGNAAQQGNNDEEQPIVPCIFIGVRSVRHDPNMTADELADHPNFPFMDGQAPTMATPVPGASPLASPSILSDEGSAGILDSASPSSPGQTSALPTIPTTNSFTTAPTASASASTSTGTSANAGTERRSLRERFMDRLNPSRARRIGTSLGNGPLQTYLVYVIGGNYPQNHPILSIPNLITGGPLTDEDMNLISELMGPAKPSTVDTAEIEKSGLKVVKGDQMEKLRENGELLDICGDRCLICLSEYEPEEDCRILNCKHGYHRECVDQWLSKGRNSCPACRSEAVDKTKLPKTTTPNPAAEDSTDIPSTGEDSSVPMEIDENPAAAASADAGPSQSTSPSA